MDTVIVSGVPVYIVSMIIEECVVLIKERLKVLLNKVFLN